MKQHAIYSRDNREQKTGKLEIVMSLKKWFDAAKKNKVDVIREMILKKFDIETKNKNGETALIVAVASGSFECSVLLLESGADLNVGDKNGWTPAKYACFRGYLNILEILVKKDPNIIFQNLPLTSNNLLLFSSQMKNSLNIVRFLVESGTNVDSRDEFGNSAFILTMLSGNTEIGKYLLSAGANVDLSNKNNSNAFILSCWKGDVETTKFLLKNGATVYRKNNKGYTGLGVYFHETSAEKIDMYFIQYIMEHIGIENMGKYVSYDDKLREILSKNLAKSKIWDECLKNSILKNRLKQNIESSKTTEQFTECFAR